MPKKKSMTATYTVTYDSSNHFQVLTQMLGSVWPKVFPYCIFNTTVMLILIALKNHFGDKRFDLPTQGNAYLTVVVAFLLVSRVNIGLGRFTEARNNLGLMYKETREIIQNSCIFTESSTTEEAKRWRHELAYRSLILLRTAMAVIDYPSDFVPAWDVPELRGAEQEDVKRVLTGEMSVRWAHIERSEWENSMRVPIRIAYLLRRTILSHPTRLPVPLSPGHEAKMNACVDNFMNGYYGMRKFLTTPVPFPLIQMARTLLFFYVFSVPFQLLTEATSGTVAKCLVVFVVTFAFMGMELTAMELDNPFGDDANDFDNQAMAMVTYEDTYLTLLDLDGIQWVNALRRKMHDGSNDAQRLPHENSWLLEDSEKMV